MEYVPFATGDAEAVFNKKISGEELSKNEIDIFKTAILKHCAKLYVKYNWAMQLHIGTLRNNNTKMYNKMGPDTGWDSINDLCIAEPLSKFMDNLEMDDCLPKTILYTLNPKDNYVLGTMLGMISRFVGMLTDSRSFVSYTRHDYLRRIMCNLIGGWVDAGEYPKDMKRLEVIVKGIPYNNAKEYFKF